MTDLIDFRSTPLSVLAANVRSGAVTAEQLTRHALAQIDMRNGRVNAFVAVDGPAAITQATAIDAAVARGENPGPLAGIPIGVKDLEHAAGFRTTFGSLHHVDDPIQVDDSIEVARLRAAGCVIVGKTHTPEHGHKGDTDNRIFGPTFNPYDLARSAGGSSGGSGAAVAAGMVPLCTGSDGGGSIRIPSAINGLFGMKCSLGRVAIGGPQGSAWADLSVRGPMAHRVADVALALDVVAGPHPSDLRCLPGRVDFMAAATAATRPQRIGYSPTLGFAPVDSGVAALTRSAVEKLADAGADIVEIPTVWGTDPLSAFLVFSNVGTLYEMQQYRANGGWDLLDQGLRAMLERAENTITATGFAGALSAAHRLNFQLTAAMENVDVLITPLFAAPTPLQGQFGILNGTPEPNWVRFTYGFNITRSPVSAVPFGLDANGMPICIQIVGAQHDDAGVIAASAWAESIFDFTPPTLA